MRYSREERIKWFEEKLGLKLINANNGRVNCAHCALRLDAYITKGETGGSVTPVPTTSAHLHSYPVCQKNDLRRSSTRDSRILERCKLPGTQQYVVHDLTQERTFLDLTVDKASQQQTQIALKRSNVENGALKSTLQRLGRRCKDGTAYGFIWLTHQDINKGHLINYFVDSQENNNEVYFIDAQLGQVVDEGYFKRFREEVFYLPSIPPEGLEIKQEKHNHIQVKEESINIMKTEHCIIVEKIINAAKEQNQSVIDEMKKKYNIDKIYNHKGMNALGSLASESNLDMKACKWLLEQGFHINSFLDGLAYGGHQDVLQSMQQANVTVDYNRIAAWATKGGQTNLAHSMIAKLLQANVKVNYNLFAAGAAYCGHADLVHSMIAKMQQDSVTVDYNRIAVWAAKGGHATLVDSMIDKMLQANVTVNYTLIAVGAACRGHADLVDSMIAKMQQANVTVDYNGIAAGAAEGGHATLVDSMIAKMLQANVTVNYNHIAECAAKGGHADLVDSMIAKMQQANVTVDYNRIAAGAAEGGHADLVDSMIAKMQQANVTVNYTLIAVGAAYGGHADLVDSMIAKMQQANVPVGYYRFAVGAAYGGQTSLVHSMIAKMQQANVTVDYNGIAEWAAKGGQTNLVHSMIAKMLQANVTVNYTLIAAGAAKGGQTNLVHSMIAKMLQANVTVNYNHIAECAAKGGHTKLANSLRSKMPQNNMSPLSQSQKRSRDAELNPIMPANEQSRPAPLPSPHVNQTQNPNTVVTLPKLPSPIVFSQPSNEPEVANLRRLLPKLPSPIVFSQPSSEPEVAKLRLLLEQKGKEIQGLRQQVEALQEQNKILQQTNGQLVAPVRFSEPVSATYPFLDKSHPGYSTQLAAGVECWLDLNVNNLSKPYMSHVDNAQAIIKSKFPEIEETPRKRIASWVNGDSNKKFKKQKK